MNDTATPARGSASRNVADKSVARQDSSLLLSPNRLKLGLFGTNLSGGASGITVAGGPPRVPDWAEVRAVGVAADQAGFEALIPIGRWKGFGGPSEFWDRSFEAHSWAAGMAEATTQINIFSTCHVGVVHPVLAAKMGATIDHISGGRWGLNLVAGWKGDEFAMFGRALPFTQERYRLSSEWLEIVRRLWNETEPFDFNGEFFDVEGGISLPNPVQQPSPPIMNAGQSATGMKFAAENADLVFIDLLDGAKVAESIRSVRELSAQAGRTTSVWGMLHVVCRETEAEARRYVDLYAGQSGDVETARRYAASLTGGGLESHDRFRQDDQLVRTLISTAGNRGVVGSPTQVVEEMSRLVEWGLDGIALCFVDYLDGISAYSDLLLPELRSSGLRV